MEIINNKKTNVIVVYADDLGFGDLSCYGAEEIHTPNIDRLCKDGLRFTSAYSTSAVCTPARYSLMTGEYPFRCDNANILPGDAQSIISGEQYTVPKLFKDAGYKTGIVGKWHLGLSDGTAPIDWNKDVNFTPNDVGFDYSFIFPATADRVPCVYMENRRVLNLDPNDPITVSYDKPLEGVKTGRENPELLTKQVHAHGHDCTIVNGIGRIGYMTGGKAATWADEDLADKFLSKSLEFIDKNKDDQFFLWYTVHQPHVPRVPNPRFAGATGLGVRGDVIVELDWCVGQLLDHLEETGLIDNTMIIFSSDNGPVLNDGYQDRAYELSHMKNHKPAGPLRGGKYSKYEGGSRVPFIVSQKGVLDGGESQALVSQVDLLASFAKMLNIELPENAGVDSIDVMDALVGKDHVGRKDLMAEEMQKGKMLRSGKWSYLHPSAGRDFAPLTQTDIGNSLSPKLYNLDYDLGQRENVAEAYPEVVKVMGARVEEIVSSKRTR